MLQVHVYIRKFGDWEILLLLAEKLGSPFNYKNSEEIFKELAQSVSSFFEMTYEKIVETLLKIDGLDAYAYLLYPKNDVAISVYRGNNAMIMIRSEMPRDLIDYREFFKIKIKADESTSKKILGALRKEQTEYKKRMKITHEEKEELWQQEVILKNLDIDKNLKHMD